MRTGHRSCMEKICRTFQQIAYDETGGIGQTWEELAHTGEGLDRARSHKCTRSRENKVRRKRHIYCLTSGAGGVVKCGSTKPIHQRDAVGARSLSGQ